MKTTKIKAPLFSDSERDLKNFEALNFNLQLFGDEGETGDGNTADAVQESFKGTDTDTDNEFASLIKGKYKDAFTRKTQSIINRRFKETKNLEGYRTRAESVLGALRAKYGLDENDFDGILSHVNGEADGKPESEKDSYKTVDSPAASEANATEASVGEASRDATDSAESILTDAEPDTSDAESDSVNSESVLTDAGSPEKSAEKVRREVAFAKRSENTVRQYADWMAQAKELSTLYPAFDLRSECEDPQFRALLLGGASVRRAYESVHHDEILSGAMEYTAKTVSEAMSRSIRARGNRPFENGLGSKAALHPTKDVNSLTDSDISEILKQVAKGKIIKF